MPSTSIAKIPLLFSGANLLQGQSGVKEQVEYIFKEDENLVSECTLINWPVIFIAVVTLQRPLLVIDCHLGQVTNEGAETGRENLSQGIFLNQTWAVKW